MVTEKKYEKFFDRLAVSGGMFFFEYHYSNFSQHSWLREKMNFHARYKLLFQICNKFY